MIYENVVRLCAERGTTIAALERACGLGNATVRGWAENNPRVDRLKKVADYFGVTVDELLKDEVQ